MLQIFTVRKISHGLAESRRTCCITRRYISFSLSSTSLFAVDAVTQLKMRYIFRQIFPFHSGLRKDRIATWLRLPLAVFLSPSTFREARDQPEPESFFPRMKDRGNEVGLNLM